MLSSITTLSEPCRLSKRSGNSQDSISPTSYILWLVIHSTTGLMLKSEREMRELPIKETSISKWILELPKLLETQQLFPVSARRFVESIFSYSYILSHIATNGNSNMHFRVTAKRRRSKRQIEEEKRQAEERKQDIEQKLSQFNNMQQQMN